MHRPGRMLQGTGPAFPAMGGDVFRVGRTRVKLWAGVGPERAARGVLSPGPGTSAACCLIGETHVSLVAP